MSGVKGRSGRKPDPSSKREYIQIRVNDAEKAALKEMAEKTNAGTISALVLGLVKDNAAGGADAWKSKDA